MACLAAKDDFAGVDRVGHDSNGFVSMQRQKFPVVTQLGTCLIAAYWGLRKGRVPVANRSGYM